MLGSLSYLVLIFKKTILLVQNPLAADLYIKNDGIPESVNFSQGFGHDWQYPLVFYPGSGEGEFPGLENGLIWSIAASRMDEA